MIDTVLYNTLIATAILVGAFSLVFVFIVVMNGMTGGGTIRSQEWLQVLRDEDKGLTRSSKDCNLDEELKYRRKRLKEKMKLARYQRELR